jgi:hypothetical protein
MTWVKLDASYFYDPKVERVSPLAELLFVRGLCHAKQHLTDGVISRRALNGLSPDDDGDPLAPERLATELVRAGLWTEVLETDPVTRVTRVTAWRVTAWASHNEPADKVREKRAAEVRRVQAWREAKKSAPKGRETPGRDEPLRAYDTRSLRDSETETETETDSLSHDDETRTRPAPPAELEREHRIDAALGLLADADVAAAQNVRNPRALREAALKTRRRDDLAQLERLALEDPSLRPEELAAAILAPNGPQAPRGARVGPCELCGVDWRDPGHLRAHAEAIAGLDRPPLTAIAGGRA